ncbi:MAG: hypothetical protein ACQEQE_09130 [Bacillota bacterium]
MEKYILDINKKIILDNFDDLIAVFLGAYNKKNKRLFFDCNGIEEFLIKLNLDDPLVKKEFYIIESQLNEKLVNIIYSNYEDIIKVLKNKNLDINWIKNLDDNRLIKCLYKSIYDFYKSDESIFFKDAKSEDLDYIKKWLNNNESILYYFFVFYEYNQLLKSNSKFKDKLKKLFENYLENLIDKYSKSLIDFKVKELNKEIKDLKKNQKKLKKIIESKKDKNLELIQDKKNIESRLNKKIELLKKENKESLNNLKKENKKLKEKNESILNTMVSKKEYNSKRKEAKKYLKKYKKFKDKFYKLKEKEDEFRVSILTVEKYLKNNGVDRKLSQLIRLYDDSLVTGNINNKYIDRHLYKIAYVSIQEDGHYYIDDKGQKNKLLNLPKEIYLENNQFIAVSSNHIFIKSFDYVFNKTDSLDFNFYEIIDTDPVKIYVDIDNVLEINTNGKKFGKSEIVVLDSNYQVIDRKSKKISKILSSFFKSIKTKKHKIIYIEKEVSNGYIGFDLINKKEIIISNNFDVLPHSIVSIYKGKLIKRFKIDNYLKDKTILNNLQVGYFIKDSSNEYIEDIDGNRLNYNLFFNRNDFYLKIGSVIGYDRFKNIIKVYDNSGNIKKTDEKRILEHNSKMDSKNKGIKREIIYDKSFLIIGNKSLSNRYIKSFRKKGVKVDFVSGHEKYARIFSKAKEFNNILFITKAASHQNYYRLKDDFNDKLIYINFEGANRLIRYVFENELKKK